MSYDNVTIWFAKNDNGEIITINEINEENKRNHFLCPVCGSDLKPKAIKSKFMTQHFAHVDASKCNNETMIHWWYKNRFLEKGDRFTVVSDKKRDYMVSEVLVEQEYETSEKTYNPDVTVITECGKRIFFEMKYSNGKEVKDYIDIWLELKDIVVEIDIKQLMLKEKVPKFKALFYEGKCFNTKRNDIYYNTIGKHKEKLLLHNEDDKTIKERVKKLDWFWDDIFKYKNREIEIEDVINSIDCINKSDFNIVLLILKKAICNDIYSEYKKVVDRREWLLQHATFKKPIPSSAKIKTAIRKLDRKYKKIDKRYKVKVERVSNKHKEYRYDYGRKVGYWKTDSYRYKVSLSHDYSDFYIKITDVPNFVVEMDNEDLILQHYEKEFKNHKIKIWKCLDCSKTFDINSDEIIFYNERKLELPKRCKSCRNKRKQAKLQEGEIIN